MNVPSNSFASPRVRAAVRRSLVVAAISLSVGGAALAAEDTELEAVVITGSRISAPNLTSTSPVVAVTQEEIKLGGRADITDMLNQLPQLAFNSLGQDLGNRTSGLTTAGGVATADLRGLGPNRTLVLIDGRRLGAGSPNTAIQSPAPDLDQIPSALVERIDVVTGGASAVYGSDAIAGVVNFIMKKNFEGVQIDAQVGENIHDNHNDFVTGKMLAKHLTPITGTSTDGETANVTITMGSNIADGAGNVTAYFGYSSMNPVASSERDFGGCQLQINGALNDVNCGGSSNSNLFSSQNATLNPEGDAYSVLGNQFVPYGTPGTNPATPFNAQPYIFMQRDDVRYNAGFMAHVDVNDNFKPYTEFNFMNDNTHQEIAPSALFRFSNPLSPTGNYEINCSNPLLSAQQRGLLCTPAEVAADTLSPGSASADVDIGRRNVEGGGRSSDYEHTNYRMVVGTKGDIAQGWNYDLYGQYYYTNFFTSNNKYMDFSKIVNALQVTGTAANPVCISGGSCVPYNPFSDGGVTQAQVDYLDISGTAAGSTTLRTLHADATGDLGVYGIRFPTAHDGIGVNIGYEYRKEHVTFKPDAAELGGMLSGFGGASVAIDSGYDVTEGFAEVRVPIVQDRTGIYDLVVDGGYRYSDYSTAGGVNTYKFEVQYAPIADLRFRGSYNRAIRAPAIIELFNPQLVGQIQFGDDPCARTRDTNNNIVPATATLAQCQLQGITAAQYGNGGTTNLVPQGTAGQLSQMQGGNPNLEPETADTYTVGLTWTPHDMLNGFTGSVDYYFIDLKNTVGALPAQLIMSNCLAGETLYCDQIVRQPLSGGLTGNNVAGGGYIIQTNVNIGAATLSGVDLQLGYHLDIGSMGSLSFNLNGAYLLESTSTPIPGGGTYDCAGLYGPTCQTVNPDWRHSFRAAWNMPWNVTAVATWRYFSGTKLDNNDPDPDLFGSKYGKVATFGASLPSASYLDLSASWDITKTVQIHGGVNNVFDKDPPIINTEIASGGSPNYPEAYDGLGRQLFIGVTAKF